MFDPFELHPEDKNKMSNSASKETVAVKDVKEIISKQLKKIKGRKTPTWGYNCESITTFFHDIITEIEKKVDKDDS